MEGLKNTQKHGMTISLDIFDTANTCTHSPESGVLPLDDSPTSGTRIFSCAGYMIPEIRHLTRGGEGMKKT